MIAGTSDRHEFFGCCLWYDRINGRAWDRNFGRYIALQVVLKQMVVIAAAKIHNVIKKAGHVDCVCDTKYGWTFQWTQVIETWLRTTATQKPIVCNRYRALPFAKLHALKPFIFVRLQLVDKSLFTLIPKFHRSIFAGRVQFVCICAVDPMHIVGVAIEISQNFTRFQADRINVIVATANKQCAVIFLQPKAIHVILVGDILVGQKYFPRFFRQAILVEIVASDFARIRADNQNVLVECQTLYLLVFTIFGDVEHLNRFGQWVFQCGHSVSGGITFWRQLRINLVVLFIWTDTDLRYTEMENVLILASCAQNFL